MLRTSLALILAILPSSALRAGGWTFGGRAGATLQNGKFVPSVAATADCQISDVFSWRTDFDIRVPDANDMSRINFQVPSNVLFHPLSARKVFDPYAGPGLTLSSSSTGDLLFGMNAVGGFLIHPARQQAFGAEWRWSWPDPIHTARGQLSMALVGRWETKF